VSRRGEFVDAAVWAALGSAILVASWRMDRLGHLSINPWSAPGLTPGVVGALMILLALALAVHARRATAADATAQPSLPPGSARRTLMAAALCVTFAGVTLGRGLPFVVEGAVFIFVFTTVFSWRSWREGQRVARGAMQALIVAVLASTVIAWLFESVFLVRLP
jgi:putative tricarboxylic transport membrane protein